MSTSGQIMSEHGTKTKKVTSNLSAKQYYFVYIDGTDDDLIVLSAAATEQPWPLLEGVDGSVDAKRAAIATSGRTKLKLGGTVAPGDKLTANSDGEAIATTTPGDFYGATAVVGGVDGDLVEVQVCQGIV